MTAFDTIEVLPMPRCPLCLGTDILCYTTKLRPTGIRIRYYYCHACVDRTTGKEFSFRLLFTPHYRAVSIEPRAVPDDREKAEKKSAGFTTQRSSGASPQLGKGVESNGRIENGASDEESRDEN